MALFEPFFERTCFLIASAGEDISALRAYLGARNVECRSADPLRHSGGIPFALKSVIKDSDFACVVLPKTPTPNLMFEVGLAVGLNKPTIIIAPLEVELPTDLRAITVIRTDRWYPKVLEPHLEAFLSTLPSKLRRKPKRKLAFKRQQDYRPEREQLRNLKAEWSGREFQEFVANLFRKAGFDVTTAPLSDFGADMAVWSPAIREQFGNPILVEVRQSRLAPANLLWPAENLAKLVNAGRGSAAVYVSLEPVPVDVPDESLLHSTPLLFVTVYELLDLLEANDFIDRIKVSRNLVFAKKG